MRDVSNVDAGGGKRLLVGPGELQDVSEGSDGDGAFDSGGPDGGGDGVGDFEHINT